MKDRCFALFVHDWPDPLAALKFALKDLSGQTDSVRSWEEAKRLIPLTPPQLVFSYTPLHDGSWTDVVEFAENAGSPVNFVAGTHIDIKFDWTAFERDALDFVSPPFEPEALDFNVQSAVEDRRGRKQVYAAVQMSEANPEVENAESYLG